MIITREMMVKRLARKSGYYEKDVRHVLQCLDDVVMECFGEVTDDEEVSIQLTVGMKCGCKVVPPRARVNPKTQEPIIVAETVKPFAKFSDSFRENIQKQYEDKLDG